MPRNGCFMHLKTVLVVSALALVGGCGKATTNTDSKPDSWPYSSAYRGLTPLSEDETKTRAIRQSEHRLGTSNGAAIAVLPAQGLSDYFRVVVVGSRDGMTVTNSVLVHRFNAKGDKIEK